MSVLVTCWTGVLRIDALEARYPGGLEGFRTWFREGAPWNTSYHHDEHLAAVSFLNLGFLDDLANRVEGDGLVGIADGAWKDFVFLNQIEGLCDDLHTCDWLQVANHPDGLRCWLADLGEPAAPEGYDPSAFVAAELSESAAAVMRGVEGREPVPEPGSIEAKMVDNIKRNAMRLRLSRDPARWRH
jgi:hypothetical protein